jgi:hypothetical protein
MAAMDALTLLTGQRLFDLQNGLATRAFNPQKHQAT